MNYVIHRIGERVIDQTYIRNFMSLYCRKAILFTIPARSAYTF